MEASINYKADFYNNVQATSQPSAEVVVPLLMDLFRPTSVIDVGCGSGAWLRQFEQHGCRVLGLDGPWVNESQLLIGNEHFVRTNLEEPISRPENFDLAICLEVAEHLPESSADTIVRSLCGISQKICFSAAIPGQGGDHHLNEQWQSYWIEKFRANGFDCYDLIRPKIWDNSKVAVHYCQNILIFAKSPASLDQAFAVRNHIADVVHPRLLADKTGPQNNSFRRFFFEFLPFYFQSRFSGK